MLIDYERNILVRLQHLDRPAFSLAVNSIGQVYRW